MAHHAQSDEIAIAALAGSGPAGALLRIAGPAIDRLLGIRALAERYDELELRGLTPRQVTTRILDQQGIGTPGAEDVLAAIPETGPALVVCNHPYGGMEGVILAHVLTTKRADLKIMANAGLRVLAELRDYFIFTNPLTPSNPKNVKSILECRRHLRSGGLLVLFPAGRVSFLQPDLGRITDAEWNRLPARLARETGATVTCVFVGGMNRRRFHQLGQIYYRFRLLMLVREMLALRDRDVPLAPSRPIDGRRLARYGSDREVTAFLRVQVYLADPRRRPAWPTRAGSASIRPESYEPLAEPADPRAIARELASLPEEQRLIQHRGYSVFCGYQHQLPDTVKEITRLRERSFRPEQEGSGKSRDTDGFDATYLHLFMQRDADGELLGAYRLGQTDILAPGDDLSGLYLSAMFRFGRSFANRIGACLELGRSFIVPEFQKSAHGLFLLWRGIGEYLVRNPRYRILYGTVSLSRLYPPRSIDLMNRVLVRPGADVMARTPFRIEPHADLVEYLRGRELSMEQLSSMLQTTDPAGRDVPVLVKQYAKLGAQFHCIGMDENFADTPGLLLSIDLPRAPDRYLDRFLGPGKAAYVEFSPS